MVVSKTTKRLGNSKNNILMKPGKSLGLIRPLKAGDKKIKKSFSGKFFNSTTNDRQTCKAPPFLKFVALTIIFIDS
jgi:hypothetical protein